MPKFTGTMAVITGPKGTIECSRVELETPSMSAESARYMAEARIQREFLRLTVGPLMSENAGAYFVGEFWKNAAHHGWRLQLIPIASDAP